MKGLNILLLLFLLIGCKANNQPVTQGTGATFSQPVKVEVSGYNGNIMEPFITRNGSILLFNNLNAAPENTNLHWAVKISDTSFLYKGELAGINTTSLEAVPTLDSAGHLYFVSNRSYATTLSTLYQGDFDNGTVTNVALINGVSKLQAGWVNFDVEVSANGQSLYFVDARFDQSGNPSTADIIIAEKSGAGFQRVANSSAIMQNINTDGLEYAAGISSNQLELYFTRLTLPFTATSSPEIMYATRQNVNEAFGTSSKIESITGFAEAPTIAPDQKTLYYHKKENGRFVLYMVRKM